MKKILLLLIPLLLIQTMIALDTPEIGWDESVYIGMGKHFFSDGGLFEDIRPVVLPFILGLLWKLNLDPILFGRLFVMLIATANLFIFYKIALFYFEKKEALFVTLLLAVTSVYFVFSTKILTGMVALLFILFGYYYYVLKKYKYFGLFFGLAFATRYPSALLFIVLMIFLWNKRELIRSAIFFGIGALPYVFVHGITIAPLLEAATHQTNPVFQQGVFFYLVSLFQQNPFVIFFIPGIYFLWKKELLYVGLIPLLYFSSILNKQIRFSLIFLPFLYLVAMYGFTKLKFKRTPVLILFSLFAITVSILAPTTLDGVDVSDFELEGTIVTYDPVFTAYFDNKFIPAYFTPEQGLEALNYDADLYIYKDVFPFDDEQPYLDALENKTFLYEKSGYFVYRDQ